MEHEVHAWHYCWKHARNFVHIPYCEKFYLPVEVLHLQGAKLKTFCASLSKKIAFRCCYGHYCHLWDLSFRLQTVVGAPEAKGMQHLSQFNRGCLAKSDQAAHGQRNQRQQQTRPTWRGYTHPDAPFLVTLRSQPWNVVGKFSPPTRNQTTCIPDKLQRKESKAMKYKETCSFWLKKEKEALISCISRGDSSAQAPKSRCGANNSA